MYRPVMFLVLIALLLPGRAVALADDCASYDSWEWAQSVYDQQPSVRMGLDPSGSGIACAHLPTGGFAPAWWTTAIPDQAIEARVIDIVDGDTLAVIINGERDTVRLYRADTPEMAGCGGIEASWFATTALTSNDNGPTIWIESDTTDRDRYDRKLGYVWWEDNGRPYLLNEVLIRSGWAEDVDYGDRLYSNQFAMAAQFAERWHIGQWELCGGFDAESVAQGGGALADLVQEGPGAGTCDPAYPTVCIPPIEVSGDLDCPQISHRNFEVLPPDPHRFDGDKDGWGCEGS